MRKLAEIERAITAEGDSDAPPLERARTLLAAAEETLEHWVSSSGAEPTRATREGFRLLALHHQGAQGVPSFNACRETCREIVYHLNLVVADPDSANGAQQARLMSMLVMHLYLFVSGKLEQAGLGEFCCSARPLRADAA